MRQRFAVSLMFAFAMLAALLAIVGIYGVLAYLTDQRRNEFGIRKALGARPRDLLALVIRQGSIPVAFGLGGGVVGAWMSTRLAGGGSEASLADARAKGETVSDISGALKP